MSSSLPEREEGKSFPLSLSARSKEGGREPLFSFPCEEKKKESPFSVGEDTKGGKGKDGKPLT